MMDQGTNDMATFNVRYQPGDADARTSKRHVGMILFNNRSKRRHVTGSKRSSWRKEQRCRSEPVSRDHDQSPAPGNNPHSATFIT